MTASSGTAAARGAAGGQRGNDPSQLASGASASSQAGAGANPDDLTKESAKAIGEDFLVSTIHVARDKKGGKEGEKEIRTIAGGRLLSELKGDEKLTAEEKENLQEQGAIIPANVDQLRRAQATQSAARVSAAARDAQRDIDALNSKQQAEVEEVQTKYRRRAAEEIATLSARHEKERADLGTKLAKAQGKDAAANGK
jgi:ACT domain-containing protein